MHLQLLLLCGSFAKVIGIGHRFWVTSLCFKLQPPSKRAMWHPPIVAKHEKSEETNEMGMEWHTDGCGITGLYAAEACSPGKDGAVWCQNSSLMFFHLVL